MQPLHCLILRGAAGTVVRRFAADTRLNGRGFTDAPLVAGDRLSIGPIEFNVLEGGRLPEDRPVQAPPPAECPPAHPSAERRELDELRARLATANRHGRTRARRLLRELRSARQQIRDKDLRRHDKPDRDPDELEQLGRQMDQRTSELDALAARLGQQQDTLRQQEESIAEQSEKLKALLAELDAQQHSLHERREKWEQEQAEAERRLQERAEELDERSRQLDARSELSDSCQTEFESRQAALDARQAELDSRHAELDAQQHSLHERREKWEQEQAEAERRLQERAEELDERSRQLDARSELSDSCQTAFDSRQAALDARRAELDSRQTELDSRQAELDTRQAEADARQRELEARETELDSRQGELDTRHAELDAGQAKLESLQAELDSRQDRLDARESELDQRCGEIESYRPEVGPGRDQPPEECDPQGGIQYEKPSGGSPESSDAVLRRLGIALSDEQTEDQTPPTSEPTRCDAARARDSRSESDPDKEESIDDYMARLLDRVRSTTGQSSAPASSPPSSGRAEARVPAPSSTREPGDSPPRAPLPAVDQPGPVEMSPRAVAPEKSVDLSAMRDLANFSAHTAIDRHARRVLVGNVTSKLMVTIVAVAAGAVLTWIWWARSLQNLTLYAAVACFLVALLWGTRYVLLGAYSILSRSGRAGRKSGGDSQAATADSQTADDRPC